MSTLLALAALAIFVTTPFDIRLRQRPLGEYILGLALPSNLDVAHPAAPKITRR